MKKLLLFFVAAGSLISATAQVQRMVLIEEFTNASCPPCAAQNPAFNALLAQNSNKVIPIKYQTSWPGTDPMNAANPSDVATRVAVYGVNGVPMGVMDGDTSKMPATPNAYAGAPAALTQLQIDNEYALSSPISMNLNHSFNGAADSVIVNLTITASQAISGNLKLHLALNESLITFPAAPGTNGEAKFENVMRKMHPDANGITLANMTAGQVVNFSWTIAIPGYVYSKTQLGVVAFVQDATSKVVHQAAFSKPPYASDLTITGIQNVTCVSTANPGVDIKNQGTVNLTSSIINYRLDGGVYQTQNWTGNLAPGATTSVNLPAITGLSNGSHSYDCYLSSPNGIAALTNQSSPSSKLFITYPTAVAAPITQDFSSQTFPPSGFGNIASVGSEIWERATVSQGGGNGSAKCAFYEITSGALDLYLPKANINLAGQTDASLDFFVAYTYYSSGGTNLYDTLQILASTNCGNSWQTVWENSGTNLATAPASGSAFTPNANQWNGYSISMNSFLGQSDVLIKFVGKSGYGNNLYLDNINLRYGVVNKLNELSDESALIVYPNPAQNQINVSYSGTTDHVVSMTLTDLYGRVYYSKDFAKNEKINDIIQTKTLASGFYMLNLKSANGNVTKKVQVQH
nr:Omp28-related outer membrane protein [Chitinophagaceae bacterium]